MMGGEGGNRWVCIGEGGGGAAGDSVRTGEHSPLEQTDAVWTLDTRTDYSTVVHGAFHYDFILEDRQGKC